MSIKLKSPLQCTYCIFYMFYYKSSRRKYDAVKVKLVFHQEREKNIILGLEQVIAISDALFLEE